MSDVWLALFGYALGTSQILMIDWIKARREHARQLRRLRADLIRASSFGAKFEWSAEGHWVHDYTPNPPRFSANFADFLTQIDFRLSDEHAGDNSIEALLSIEDGFAMMQRHVADIFALIDLMLSRPDDAAGLRRRLTGHAAEYDRLVDYNLYLVDDAIRDVERRLNAMQWPEQLRRTFVSLPEGTNPGMLRYDDPKLEEWKRTRPPMPPDKN